MSFGSTVFDSSPSSSFGASAVDSGRNLSSASAALFASVQWDSLLCGDNGKLDRNGTNIPMLVDWADGCSALMVYHKDGFY